jgi:hypothetical protein
MQNNQTFAFARVYFWDIRPQALVSGKFFLPQKKPPVVYKTDKIANLHGHEVIRTPVRH